MGKVLKTISLVAAMGALIVATGGLALFGTTAAVTLFGISAGTLTLVSLGAGILSTLLTPKPKQPPTQLSRLNVSLDPSTPRKAVLGTTAMPLDLRYHESSGTDQEYIDYIIAVAAHKVASITEIWFEEKQAWTVAGGVAGTYSGYLTVDFRTEGTAANYILINGGGKWGSSRRLTGCAYLHLRIKRTGNTKKAESPLVNGLPSRVTVIGEGALLYDPRKDSTVPGGSGAHRADNQATWGAYTDPDDCDNPVLQLLWWLVGWEINGKLSVGCGIPYNRIDMESFITAANICDENIALASGGTQKRYRTSGTASDADDRLDIINNLLQSFNGTLRDAGGKLSVTAIKNDLADYVIDFDENDMIGEFDWQQTRGLTDNYNIARGRYVDPSANSLYQMVDYPEVGFTSPDGIERVMSVDLAYIEDGRRAQRIAKQILQRNQYRGMLSATFNVKALGCQVGDIVRISLDSLGWSKKLFRVVSQEIRFDGQVPLALIEENAAIYAWDRDDVAPVTPTAPTIYNPLNSPLILGIDDAGTTADWSGIINDNGNKPEDNATRNVNRGDWSGSSVVYFIGDFVQYDGSSYSAVVDHTSTAGNGPPGANWALLAAGGGGGDVGPAGPAAISGFLTKEAVQLFAYANGGVASYAPASGSFKVFSGNTDVSSLFSLSTISNPQALTVGYSGQTYSVTAGFDANEDTASLTIRATGSGTYAGVTIDKVFSLSKAKGGYEIVASLPLTDLFEGRVVFLTTDDKLYRYTGVAWTAAVPALDITGTLADAQIAALAASKITGQLTDTQLAAIAAAKVTGQLTNAQIADLAATKVTGQLTDVQIAAIAAAKVTGQITTTQITDNAVTSAKIVAGAVTASEIAAGAVVAGKIAAEAVTATEIAAGSITTAKIAAGAVTANEIAANTITAAKIAAGAITSNEIAANTITAADIAASTITAAEIAAGTITGAKIAAGTIAASNIAANTITASQIAANTITAGQIASNAITADKISAGAITAAKVGTNEIIALSANIKDGVIETAKIGDLQVTTLKIGGNAVTVPVTYTGTNAFISSAGGAVTVLEMPSFLTVGDATDGGVMAVYYATFDGRYYLDSGQLITFYADYNDGFGYQFLSSQIVGTPTTSGNTYPCIPVALAQSVSGIQQVKFKITVQVYNLGTGGTTNSSYHNDIQLCVLGVKR